MAKVSREAALAALDREIARQSLRDYALRVSHDDYAQPLQVIKLLDMLQSVEERLESGENPKVIVEMPPRSSKSTHVSRLYPSWHMGRHPKDGVILASYADTLATDNGRAVRDYLDHPQFPFPVKIRADVKAAGRWQTEDGGGLIAVGVGTSLTGWPFPGNLALVDDPVKGRIEAESEIVRDNTWVWWQTTLLTRMAKQSAIVLTGCLTGDTPVRMADGTEVSIRDIRPGTRVATYDGRSITTSKVTNWANQGADATYAIRMSSGNVVRANARHPWLVQRGGTASWRRTATLKKGDAILRVIGGNGVESHAPKMGVASQQSARGSALRTTTKPAGRVGTAPRQSTLARNGGFTSDTAMASTMTITTPCLQNRGEFAASAASLLLPRTALAGQYYSSTTTMGRTAFEGFSATTATSLLGMDAPAPASPLPLNTSALIPDQILDIEESSVEDVFDIEVEGTGTFIANGLVSHNTRWHEDDLIGRVLNSPGASDWLRLSIPYLAETDDPLGRVEGAPLETFGSPPSVEKGEISAYDFSALYQQRPTPAGGGVFKKEWFERTYSTADLERLKALPRWKVIQTIDLGGKQGVGHDPSAISTWGTDGISFYLLDYWSSQAEYADIKPVFVARFFEWKPRVMYVEDATWAQPLISDLRRGTGVRIAPRKIEGSKWIRADSVAPEFEAGRVAIPERAPWLDAWLHEHLAFPNGKHDEAVDTTSMAIKALGGGMAHVPYITARRTAQSSMLSIVPRTEYTGSTAPQAM